MDFVTTREEDLGAPPEDVAQEAVDATATTYSNDPGIDVEEHLRVQLASRGLRAVHDEDVARIAGGIRAGKQVSLGDHDGSVDGPV